MPHELAVLFLHHADDAATRANLAAVRHFNPGVPVVPISNWGKRLPGGFHCRDICAGGRRLLPSYRGSGLRGAWRRHRGILDRMWVWRNSDLPAYFWARWRRRPVNALRWVIFEWDMYCNANLLDWYGPSFSCPVVATSLQIPGINDNFPFFNEKEVATMPPPLRPFRMACNPWAGMMFGDDALHAIADRVHAVHYCNGFCEVRVATVANSLGLRPQANANPLSQQTLRAVTDFGMADIENFEKPSVFHRVKRLSPAMPS